MMTLLDQPSKAAPAAGSDQPDQPDESDRPAGATSEPGPAQRRGGDAERAAAEVGPLRWFLGALLLGAGAIHLAVAPSHLDASGVEGAGFLAAAWAQLLLAGAVVMRPTRRVLAAAGAANLLLIALWALSRTAGLPFGEHRGHPETVSVVDGISVGLEAVGLALVLALLTRVGAGVLQRANRTSGAALVGAVGALVLATGAVASPGALDHAAGSHGDHGTEMAGGHAHGDAAGGHGAAAAGDDLGFSELSNGHQHEEGSDEPLTTEERVTLANQIAATAELVERYPTLGDAEAAGWRRAGPFSPGLGTHYTRGVTPNTDGDMDPEDLANPTLVYDGLEPDAPLAGFMYNATGTEAPEGFAGPNDHWHYHESVCVKVENGAISTPFGADLEGVTEQMCTDVGGRWIANTGYMVHLWVVPGYESPDGLFTELNPKITCPDGTYHRIPIREVGSRDTVCRNP